MNSVCLIFLFILGITTVFGEVIRTRGCGSTAEIHSLSVKGCDRQPCIMLKGDNVSITIDFTPSKSYASLTAGAYWTTAVVDLPMPGMDINGCNYVEQCPIEAGQRITYSQTINIRPEYPTGVYTIKYRLYQMEHPVQELNGNEEEDEYVDPEVDEIVCEVFRGKIVNVE